MEPVICPSINQHDLNSFDEAGKMGRDMQPITVNVFDSRNAEAPKMRTKLSHDETNWLEQMQITPRVNRNSHRPVPVLFETNNVRVSKRKLKDLLLTGQFALADLEMFKMSDKAGHKKEGRIVIHKDSIDHLGPLVPNQKEYSGQSESGDGAPSCISSSVPEKTVTYETSTSSSTKTLKSKKPPCLTKKERQQIKMWPLPKKPETLDDISVKPVKEASIDKSYAFKRLNVRYLVEKQTQTDGFEYDENFVKKEIDTDTCNLDQDTHTEGGVEKTSQTELVMEKPAITLCNLKLEDVKEVKNSLPTEVYMDTNEGKRIWAEVDAMIKRSIPKGKLRNGKLKPDTPSVASCVDGSVHSIEFHSRFPRFGKEAFNFVPKDHMWELWNVDESNNNNNNNNNYFPYDLDLLPLCNRETTFDRVYGQQPNGDETNNLLYQHMGRFGGPLFSENDYDAQSKSSREKTLDGAPLMLNPMERKKYEETLRALDRDHGYLGFDPITMQLIHPVRMANSAPATTHMPPNGVRLVVQRCCIITGMHVHFVRML